MTKKQNKSKSKKYSSRFKGKGTNPAKKVMEKVKMKGNEVVIIEYNEKHPPKIRVMRGN